MMVSCVLVGGPMDGLPAKIDGACEGVKLRTAAGRLAIYVDDETDPFSPTNGFPFRFIGWGCGLPSHVLHAGVLVPLVGSVK
jgi:hypothetical protein